MQPEIKNNVKLCDSFYMQNKSKRSKISFYFQETAVNLVGWLDSYARAKTTYLRRSIMVQQHTKLDAIFVLIQPFGCNSPINDDSDDAFSDRNSCIFDNCAFCNVWIAVNYLIFQRYNENMQNYAIFIILCEKCQIQQKVTRLHNSSGPIV